MKALIPALALFMTTAPITVQPSRHDFGEAGVNAVVVKSFRIAVPPGADSTADLDFTITGANPADFGVNPTWDGSDTCYARGQFPGRPPQPWQAGPCNTPVYFMPKSVGIKTATLVATDTRGNRGTAVLIGKGVAAICEMKVVSCNYSHLYTGVVRWNSVLKGQRSSTTVSVQVDVVMGRASCNGSQTDTDVASGSKRGNIQGDGLVAVEFEKDENDRLIYNVTVACPSPAWPATDFDAAIPSRRAELGDFEQQSYEQPAASVGMNLEGSNSYPAPEADPVNGVDGTVTMSWRLVRS